MSVERSELGFQFQYSSSVSSVLNRLFNFPNPFSYVYVHYILYLMHLWKWRHLLQIECAAWVRDDSTTGVGLVQSVRRKTAAYKRVRKNGVPWLYWRIVCVNLTQASIIREKRSLSWENAPMRVSCQAFCQLLINGKSPAHGGWHRLWAGGPGFTGKRQQVMGVRQ